MVQSEWPERNKITALDSIPRHVAVSSPTQECSVSCWVHFLMVCRRRCEAHPVLALGPFPPLQPYPVQGMRPLLTRTLIAFSRLGCGAFWVGAGIFFMAINQKQQCRFIKKLYQAPQEFVLFSNLKVQDTGRRRISTRSWVCG